MSEDKPLHVQVAEALGWEYVPQKPDRLEGGFWIAPNRDRIAGQQPPSYDLDWSATGPLIEKYGFGLDFDGGGQVGSKGEKWMATTPEYWSDERNAWVADMAYGLSALDAICNLILALKQAGKL